MKLRSTSTTFLFAVTGMVAILFLLVSSGCSSGHGVQVSKPGELPPPPEHYANDTIPIRTPDGAPAIFGVKSGKIMLQYTGDRTGTRTLEFDQYGMRVRITEFSQPFPIGSPGPRDSMISVRIPEWYYRVDLSTNEARRIYNETQPIEKFLQKDADAEVSLGEELLKELNMTRLADTTIQGYECRTYLQELPGITIKQWVWRGLTLREEFSASIDGIHYFVEPVLVSLDIDFEDNMFTPLEGYRIREVSDPGDMYPYER